MKELEGYTTRAKGLVGEASEDGRCDDESAPSQPREISQGARCSSVVSPSSTQPEIAAPCCCMVRGC